MQREIKISPIQFSMLVIALTFRDFHIMNPTRFAKQDAWIAFVIGMIMGLVIITIYILIAKIHPGKNLIEILQDTFGKYVGILLSILYIFFFLHLSSLILRALSEYMIIVNYYETPQYFIMLSIMLVIVYTLRKGFEVAARAAEIFIPVLILFVVFLFFILTDNFKFDFFLPVLKNGVKPILNTGFIILNFPFGGLVVLLMIFPYLNERNKMVKHTYISVIIGGLLLLMIIVRDLVVLGSNISSFVVFPPNISTSLIPTAVLEPFISMNLLIAVAGTLCVYINATSKAISILFNVEDKTLIIPIVTIVIGVSLWQFNNISEIFKFLTEVFPYYSFVFQAIIPLGILIVSY